MILRIAMIATALVSSGAPAGSISLPDPAALCPADTKIAFLLAASDLVLIGRMGVARQRFTDEAEKPSPEYLEIPVQIERVLKGGDVSSATLRFYPKDASYKPSNAAVLDLANAPAVLFLTRVEDGPVGLYFAGHSPDALQPATDEIVSEVSAEASRQAQIFASWHGSTTLPLFAEVRALVARLGRVSGDEQQRVFDRLEALGEEAVPAIVAQMDDRRPLHTRAISLVNHSPDALEPRRHYGPEQVVDGLAAVLSQITGVSFGSIMNGGSGRQRGSTIAGWRVYANDLACKKGK